MADSLPSPPTLAYSRDRRQPFVVRQRRRLIAAALILAVGTVTYRWYQPASQHLRWIYWSRQCANFKMPADIPLEVSGFDKVKAVIASDPNYTQWPYQRANFASAKYSASGAQDACAVYLPRAWRNLCDLDQRCANSALIGESEPLVFLGRMRRPDGQTRLVAIGGGTTNALDLMSDNGIIVLPEPNWTDSVPSSNSLSFFVFSYSGAWDLTILRGGSLDPQNPSHLRIPFKARVGYDQWAEGVLDGYLSNNDTFTFSFDDKPEFKNHVHVGIRNLRQLPRPQAPATAK